MKLQVTTPSAFTVDADDIRHVRIEDPTGSVGIQRHHAPFVSLLEPSVVTWRDHGGAEHHAAVRGGVLAVTGDVVAIATREAITGDDLDQLERDVVTRFRREKELERSAHGGAVRLETAVLQRVYEYVRGERPHALAEQEENSHGKA